MLGFGSRPQSIVARITTAVAQSAAAPRALPGSQWTRLAPHAQRHLARTAQRTRGLGAVALPAATPAQAARAPRASRAAGAVRMAVRTVAARPVTVRALGAAPVAGPGSATGVAGFAAAATRLPSASRRAMVRTAERIGGGTRTGLVGAALHRATDAAVRVGTAAGHEIAEAVVGRAAPAEAPAVPPRPAPRPVARPVAPALTAVAPPPSAPVVPPAPAAPSFADLQRTARESGRPLRQVVAGAMFARQTPVAPAPLAAAAEDFAPKRARRVSAASPLATTAATRTTAVALGG